MAIMPVKGNIMRVRLADLLDLVEYVNERFYRRYVEPFSCWLDPSNAIMRFTLRMALCNIWSETPFKSDLHI